MIARECSALLWFSHMSNIVHVDLYFGPLQICSTDRYKDIILINSINVRYTRAGRVALSALPRVSSRRLSEALSTQALKKFDFRSINLTTFVDITVCGPRGS